MDVRLTQNQDQSSAQSDWELDRIVADLRDLRGEWRETTRPQGVIYELPSREALASIVEGLSAGLFPRHFGRSGLTEEAVDFFVGSALAGALEALREQVRRELLLTADLPVPPAGVNDTGEQEKLAVEITREFAARLPKVRALLETDIQAAFRGDPAARSLDEILFCYPGIVALIKHRLAHELYRLGAPLLARIIAEIAHAATGIDIHPGAQIDGSFFIDHGTGVVIGETAIIGHRVRLYQAVTLGAKRFNADETGALIKGEPRHPIIEEDVVIYAGATILGRITIGRGSSIGGNVWLTHSVPPGSNITQAQTRSAAFADGGGI